jgi:acyl-CoA thioester hydrolase
MKIEPAKIQVRFSDCDMMGHVNNAVYLSYFEMARIYYFGILLAKDRDWKKEGVLLRKNEVEYLKPVLLHEVPEISVFFRSHRK